VELATAAFTPSYKAGSLIEKDCLADSRFLSNWGRR